MTAVGAFAEVPGASDRAPDDWCEVRASPIQKPDHSERIEICGDCTELIRALLGDPTAKVVHGG